ncbi:hypothetical protein [Marinobacter salarius]|uniref:Uncharacterized protein n=1 Tax=Marinobacter salarius TaxID=1420917 RepID=A0A1W6KFK6_9GAMM|nr:hypothetical protein [Marinobacter salarius]ARM86181.1 hypothetical protein MARSALSMR5_04161 [Marinobacter salarius]
MEALAALQASLFTDDEFAHPGTNNVDLRKRPESIYERLLAEDKKRRNKILSVETRNQLDERQMDGFGFNLNDATARVTRYASGVLSPAYWKAYKASGRPLCVSATELGEKRLERVKRHVAEGGTLLVDSGAFIYMTRAEAMPWSTVANRYFQIAKAASKDAKVAFTLPDAVGDQAKSLHALKNWGDRLIQCVGPDHECLLPIQTGELDPADYIKRAQKVLTKPFSGIAIPCGAAPMPPEKLRDLRNLSPEECPQRIHLLGISNKKKALATYTTALEDVWPTADITCDAVEFRQDVGKNELLTVMRGEIMEAIRHKALETVDWTELSHDLENATHTRLIEYINTHFPTSAGDDRRELIASLENSPIMVSLETQAFHAALEERFGPYATSMATYSTITHKVPRLLNDYWANHAPIEPSLELDQASADDNDHSGPGPQ